MIGANSANRAARNEPETPCLAMRPRKAAKALGICERTLWKHTERGEIPHIRLGKAILYPVDSLRHWLKGQAQDDNIENNGGSEE